MEANSACMILAFMDKFRVIVVFVNHAQLELFQMQQQELVLWLKDTIDPIHIVVQVPSMITMVDVLHAQQVLTQMHIDKTAIIHQCQTQV